MKGRREETARQEGRTLMPSSMAASMLLLVFLVSSKASLT